MRVGCPNSCWTVSVKASCKVSHNACICSTGRALSRRAARGGRVLDMRAQDTCSPAVSPSSVSGNTAIFRRSWATALATSEMVLYESFIAKGVRVNASRKMMRPWGPSSWPVSALTRGDE